MSNLYGVGTDEVKSKSQRLRVLLPRYASMKYEKDNECATLSALAKKWRHKSHATVSNAIKAYENILETRPQDRELFKQATEILSCSEAAIAQFTDNIPFVYYE